MELQQLAINQTLNSRTLSIVANLNPCLAENETLLISYYKRVRATWSNSAIKTVQKATGLKLTNKLNRCQFAIEAAKQELQFIQAEIESTNSYLEQEQLLFTSERISSELPNITFFPEEPCSQEQERQLAPQERTSGTPPEPKHECKETSNPVDSQLQIAFEQIEKLSSQLKEKERQLEQKEQQLEQSSNFSVLLLTNRLLAPGLPLNGTEESPAMRILGSPKTLTELEANYRELIKREHPDVSPFPSTEAIERFAYVRSLYRITREHWQQLKPTAVITETELKKRMIAPVPFAPESFWAA